MAENEQTLKREAGDQGETASENAVEAAKRAAKTELQRILAEELKNDGGRHSRSQPAAASRS